MMPTLSRGPKSEIFWLKIRAIFQNLDFCPTLALKKSVFSEAENRDKKWENWQRKIWRAKTEGTEKRTGDEIIQLEGRDVDHDGRQQTRKKEMMKTGRTDRTEKTETTDKIDKIDRMDKTEWMEWTGWDGWGREWKLEDERSLKGGHNLMCPPPI